MIIGILALSMLVGVFAAVWSLVSGFSLLAALGIYTLTGIAGVLGFAIMRILPRRRARGVITVST